MTKDNIGIDISKDKLDVFRQSDAAHRQFDNTAKGLVDLRAWLGPDMPARVVYEATGPYHRRLEVTCTDHLPLCKVNPLQARRFAQAAGKRAKTDKVDAAVLARMGMALALEPDRPKDKDAHDLKELAIHRTSLIKEQTRLKNRLKTQNLALTKRQTAVRLKLVAQQLEVLDAEIKTKVRAQPERKRAYEILNSIPGIGPVVAATILIECPEIGRLENKQIAALTGLAPMTRQSGQWKGRSFIQGGRKYLRDGLYMPALVAIRFNPDMKAKYEKMRKNGKPAKVAITAIMRKLIELANTLTKNNRIWEPKCA